MTVIPLSNDRQYWRSVMSHYYPIVGIFVLFSALVIPPIVFGASGTSESDDMIRNHLPQINTFIETPLAIFSYPASAAPTPGHHLALAWFAKVLGYTRAMATDLPIRFANAAFGYLVLVVPWRFLARQVSPLIAAALTLPLACSAYVVFASIWINTDNGALLFYEILICGLFSSNALPLYVIVVSALMVMWRQVYLPVVGVFPIFWLMNAHRWKSIFVPTVATILPCAIIFAYYLEWRGLTPPGFQNFNGVAHQVALPLSALALVGILSPFYWSFIRIGTIDLLRKRLIWVIMITAGVLAVWLSGPTDYDVGKGRWGALVWSLTRVIPIGGSHSLIVLMFAVIGAIVLMGLVRDALICHEVPYEMIGLGLFLVGYCAQVEAFQRYIEAIILFSFSIASARRRPEAARACIGPLVLATLFGLLVSLRTYNVLPRIFG